MIDSRKIHFSMKALIFFDERFLILHKNDAQREKPWDLPGGGVQFGEDPNAALIREIKEETGMTVEVICPLETWYYQKNSHEFLMGVIFCCKAHDNKVTLSDEHFDYCWVSADELKQYTLQPSILAGVKKIKAEKIIDAYKKIINF